MSSSTIGVPNCVTYVYGAPRDDEKQEVWRRMRNIANGVQGTWLCMGDFNDVTSCFEKLGNKPIDVRRTLSFQNMLSDCGLLDLNFNGAQYTWHNGRVGDAHIKERLDRAVANVEFREVFQNPLVLHI